MDFLDDILSLISDIFLWAQERKALLFYIFLVVAAGLLLAFLI